MTNIPCGFAAVDPEGKHCKTEGIGYCIVCDRTHTPEGVDVMPIESDPAPLNPPS